MRYCPYAQNEVTVLLFFFFNDTATTEIYTLSLHDALPIFDDGTARVAEAEQFGDLVEGFAGGVVAGLAEEAVLIALAYFEQVGMAAGDHQRKRGKLDRRPLAAGFEDHGMDVAFDVVDRDQRNAGGETETLGVSEADQQRPDEAGSDGDRD